MILGVGPGSGVDRALNDFNVLTSLPEERGALEESGGVRLPSERGVLCQSTTCRHRFRHYRRAQARVVRRPGTARPQRRIAVLWAFFALGSLRPYVRISAACLAISVAPFRPTQRVPWGSIQRAARTGPKAIELALAQGKPLKISLGLVGKGQRDALVGLLEQHVGPLESAG